MKIVIYTTPKCSFCDKVKKYLDSLGKKYEAYDITTDISRRDEMVRISGMFSVPITSIDGKLVSGWDKQAIDNYLNIQ